MDRGELKTWTQQLVREEKGQSAVLVSLTAVVFIAFLIFLADIGRVVHDKILAQEVGFFCNGNF